MKEEAERAALMVRSATLRRKQELEIEELQLKAKMEQLVLDTAIAESDARLKVFKEYDSEKGSINSIVSQRSQSKPKDESTNAMQSLNAAARGQTAYAPDTLVQPLPNTQQIKPTSNSHPRAEAE